MYRSVGCKELVEKALIPGIDTILKYLLDGLDKPVLS